MDKIRSGIRLLALFSIFFVYKAIMGVIENNINEVTLWSIITIVYIISLIIAYFVVKTWEKQQKI
ncbi:MAG: hypothetical protein JSV23_07135 [Promethearchaeota archaeon]|nr:MAG: hypothetical protein JSV23_07135 [Candidatus Lokiarchaeota archaeon]